MSIGAYSTAFRPLQRLVTVESLSLHEQGIVRQEDRCPFHSDTREIARKNVFALRLHAALDPGDEVIEGALARLGIESAVAPRAKDTLHEQITCPGGDRTAAI